MRILHIVGNSRVEDTADRVRMLQATLPPSEFEQHCCQLRSPEFVKPESGPEAERTFEIRYRHTGDLLALKQLHAKIVRLQPDLVHTWQPDAGLLGRLAAWSAGVRNMVAGRHSVEGCGGAIATRMSQSLDRRTSRLVTCSAAVRDFCVADGWRTGRVVTIANAATSPQPARLTRAELLTELHLPESSKLVLCIAALTVENRLKELIWAVDQLKAVGAPAYLVIVGDGPLRGRLERYRWQNRVDERVRFLGAVADTDSLLAHADVVWHAGSKLGQSSVLLSAMAAGRPVVAADASGSRELVCHGERGYLVALDERAGFARWTLPLLEDAGLAEQIGKAGQSYVAQFHRADEVAEQYARLYRDVLDRHAN